MREIKFRAWDKKYKNMIHPRGGIQTGGVLLDLSQAEPDTFLLMQFTGLLDKNGKDCYESDIIKYDGKEGVVEWLGHGFWVCEFSGDHYWPSDFEIVGNIYEDSHLLNEKV